MTFIFPSCFFCGFHPLIIVDEITFKCPRCGEVFEVRRP